MPSVVKSAHVTFAGKPIGRNQRCPCGSGKKFKDCHLLEKRERDKALNDSNPEQLPV